MNVNKGNIVFAIYQIGNFYSYKKERFLKYQNGFAVCTIDLKDGVTMGYDEICINEKDAINRCNVLNKQL